MLACLFLSQGRNRRCAETGILGASSTSKSVIGSFTLTSRLLCPYEISTKCPNKGELAEQCQQHWARSKRSFNQRQTVAGLAAGEALMTQEVIERIASLVEQKGSDIWWQADTAALLPDSLQSRAETLKKGLDTMDVYVSLAQAHALRQFHPYQGGSFCHCNSSFPQKWRRPCFDTQMGSTYASLTYASCFSI